MLNISSNARLFLYQQPVRLHKSFEGLSAEVEQTFPGELLSGSYFIGSSGFFMDITQDLHNESKLQS